MINDKSEITDIINYYLTKIGVARTKGSGIMSNLWEVRALPGGDFEIVYLDDNLPQS